MTKVRTRGDDVRAFILQNVEKHPANICKITANKFGITRQAVNKHLQRLTAERALIESGNTRNRVYKLCPLVEWKKTYEIAPGLAEDVVWREDVTPVLGPMPDNVTGIWHFAFTEMFNNAIDHSQGKTITVMIERNAISTDIGVIDNGIGIFKKIQNAMSLLDERHAVLELSKGKFTTDPKNHSGQGIFFSSRMFEFFTILSGEVCFSHKFGDDHDWILERAPATGTAVWMRLNNHTSRTTKKVFDQYSSKEDYGFNKTVVPVALARYGNEQLVSRSQAKRLLARVELFQIVVLDFEKVPLIGQSFADEIFRVFKQYHPEIELHSVNANTEVKKMIGRALSGHATDTAR